jgi:hypothetical protein
VLSELHSDIAEGMQFANCIYLTVAVEIQRRENSSAEHLIQWLPKVTRGVRRNGKLKAMVQAQETVVLQLMKCTAQL